MGLYFRIIYQSHTLVLNLKE